MKNTSILFGAVIATLISAGFQAKADQFTETFNYTADTQADNYGSGVEVYNTPYTSDFTYASLKDSGNVAFQASDTISSAEIIVTMYDAKNQPTTLDLGSIDVGSQSPNTDSPDPLTYTLTGPTATAGTEWNYIDTHSTIAATVSADCYMQDIELIVNTTTSSGGSNGVPDGASTLMLLGGSLAGLGLLKRKMV